MRTWCVWTQMGDVEVLVLGTHCMCVRMDCVQTQISVKKKTKRKKLTFRHMNMLRVRADALRADVLVCGHG